MNGEASMQCDMLRLAMMGMILAALGGCYYEIHDARSGKAFYTAQWAAADGYQGPLTFEDHTGAKRRIEHAVVYRIGKREFLEATEPSPPEETQSPAPE
jgi:hypothetical protein